MKTDKLKSLKEPSIHSFKIIHMPKFIWGIFLIVFPGIVVLTKIAMFIDGNPTDTISMVLFVINLVGVIVGVFNVMESTKYTYNGES